MGKERHGREEIKKEKGDKNKRGETERKRENVVSFYLKVKSNFRSLLLKRVMSRRNGGQEGDEEVKINPDE